jgi:hypothetical protein
MTTERIIYLQPTAAYLAGLGHREAAIEDSRLLPLVPLPFPARA